MKRHISLIIILVMGLQLWTAMAQRQLSEEDRQRWTQKMRQYKHDFLIKELDLTREQQNEFFPLYDAMEWRMRTRRPDMAAAVKTARRNCSLLMACEQEKVKSTPPGAIFSKAAALSLRYPIIALRIALRCLAKAGGSSMMRS